MTSTSLMINATPLETRVALLEPNGVAEVYIERVDEAGIVGNIYKGKVVRVLPGIQAAFVDIGLERVAFLYIADVHYPNKTREPARSPGAPANLTERPEDCAEDVDVDAHRDGDGRGEGDNGDDNREVLDDGEDATGFGSGRGIAVQSGPPIEKLLKVGQEILVQVSKAPLGTKGPRLTTHIALPGRFVVFLPQSRHIGVSRRINDEDERARLRRCLDECSGGEFGLIARTAAEGMSEKELQADVDVLNNLWKKILSQGAVARAPSLVYRDLDLVLRLIRDLHVDITRILVDSLKEHDSIREFITAALPSWAGSLEFYDRPEPIFDHFSVEVELERALARKVWLRSGGYLVIDEAEALCAVDVNTGRFVGRRSLEDTILQTNLEAVKEVVHQLRLRNVGGLIIIDFIDMEKEESRAMVVSALEEALKPDRARTNVTQISSLGLVEMTRKRVQESLRHVLTETCFYCEGRGFIKSKETICNEIIREVMRLGARIKDDCLTVRANPRIIDALLAEDDRAALEELEQRLSKHVVLVPVRTYHIEEYKVGRLSESQRGGGGEQAAGDPGDLVTAAYLEDERDQAKGGGGDGGDQQHWES